MNDEVLTNEEIIELQKFLGTGSPTPDEKHNVHTFLYKVATSDDTTKLGNLNESEVGNPKLPIRTYKELALFCKDVAEMEYFSDYFLKLSEVITSTSLSKDAKLINLAVVSKKELADVTKRKQEPRGFFKKKQQSQEGLQ